MKGGKIILGIFAAGLALCMGACSKNRAAVSGRIDGGGRDTLRLESVTAGGISATETTVADADGSFRFNVKLPSGHTALYILETNGINIPLFIAPGDRITLSASRASFPEYAVGGSRESELTGRITSLLRDGSAKLERLSKAAASAADETVRQEVVREYSAEYRRVKQAHIKFIMENSGTLAAVYALNQRLPGDDNLADGVSDIVYYREVAAAVEEVYPDSPYLAELKRRISNYDATMALAGEMALKAENPAPFPEIAMADRYGKTQKLSDRLGNVIILDFWSCEAAGAAPINAEYRELYKEFGDKGLEIFQVSVDSSRSLWATAVQEQQIPWTTVFDAKSAGAVAAGNYNVTEIPANYLISKDGEIIGRDLFGDRLRPEVTRALGK